MKTLYTFAVLGLCGLLSAQSPLDSVALDVAHHELLFSHTSVVKGRNAAFLEFFDDSCLILDPVPVLAKPVYRNLPPRKFILTWRPSRVEISSSGDFAYSTGPWEIRPARLTDTAVSYGHYFSIWRNTKKGWKVLFDHGISYSAAEVKQEGFTYLVPVGIPKKDVKNMKKELVAAEEKFRTAITRGSAVSAYEQFAANNILLQRGGKYPFNGKRSAVDEVANDRRPDRFSSDESTVSSTGDLGYSYGISVTAEKDTSNYIRVWRYENEWKIAVDIVNSIH
ncbi:MAG: nuclear transport factor 2 family protein [Bacteroidota bacterium]